MVAFEKQSLIIFYVKLTTETVDGFTKYGPAKQRIESGYYDGSEDETGHTHIMQMHKFSLKKRGGHCSTKSTQSHCSVTSEIGSSSYVSSTNISINSGAEEEGVVHTKSNNSGKKKTGILPHFNKHSSKKFENPFLLDPSASSSPKKKSNLLIGKTNNISNDCLLFMTC